MEVSVHHNLFCTSGETRHLVVVDEVLVCGHQFLLLDGRVAEEAGPGLEVLGSQPAHERRLVLAQAQEQAEHVVLHLAREALQAQVQKRGRGSARCEPGKNAETSHGRSVS